MRKQELVHLHGLCMLVRDHVEAREDPPPAAFGDYDRLEVSPSAIYRGKRAHRRAVQALASDIASAVSDESAQPTASPIADGTDTDGEPQI